MRYQFFRTNTGTISIPTCRSFSRVRYFYLFILRLFSFKTDAYYYNSVRCQYRYFQYDTIRVHSQITEVLEYLLFHALCFGCPDFAGLTHTSCGKMKSSNQCGSGGTASVLSTNIVTFFTEKHNKKNNPFHYITKLINTRPI